MHKTAEVTLASAETPNEVKKDAGHSKESEGAIQNGKTGPAPYILASHDEKYIII